MRNNQKTEVRDLTSNHIQQNEEEEPSYSEIEEMRKKLGDNFLKNLFGIKDTFLKNNIFRLLYDIMDMLLEDLKRPKFFRMDFKCYLDLKEREDLISHRKSSCCYTCGKGIKGNIIFLIVMTIFNIVFNIASKVTSFLNRVNDIISKEKNHENNENKEINNDNDNFAIKLLKKYKTIVNSIIICHLIICILFLGLVIFEYIIYNKKMKKDTKFSRLRKILVLINFIFYHIFHIFTNLLFYTMYSFVFAIIIIPNIIFSEDLSLNDLKGKELMKFIIRVSHFLFFLLLIIFNMLLYNNFKTIRYLLEIHNKDDDEGIEDNLDKIRNKSIFLGNQNINIQIKLNKGLYIINPKIEDNFRDIVKHEFKPILLENLRSDFIYMHFKNEAIKNMFSFALWKYPKKDEIVYILNEISQTIFVAINFYILTILLHIKNIYTYLEIKNYYSINDSNNYKFKMYKIFEKFEYYVNESRFYIYIISFIIIQIIIVKRFYYGGVSNPIHLNISKIVAILFFVIKIIYLLLSLGLIILGIFSLVLIVNYKDLQEEINGEVGFPILLFIIIILHIAINLGAVIVMIKHSLSQAKKLCSLFISYKNELVTLYERKKGITKLEFIGYDRQFHTLNEIIIPGLPRFLFYALDGKDGYLDNNIVIHFDDNASNIPSKTNREFKKYN